MLTGKTYFEKDSYGAVVAPFEFKVKFLVGPYITVLCNVNFDAKWKLVFNIPIFGDKKHAWNSFKDYKPQSCYLFVLLKDYINVLIEDKKTQRKEYVFNVLDWYTERQRTIGEKIPWNIVKHVFWDAQVERFVALNAANAKRLNPALNVPKHLLQLAAVVNAERNNPQTVLAPPKRPTERELELLSDDEREEILWEIERVYVLRRIRALQPNAKGFYDLAELLETDTKIGYLPCFYSFNVEGFLNKKESSQEKFEIYLKNNKVSGVRKYGFSSNMPKRIRELQ